ncbi:RsmE family RNA methyltransferase [Candidatus Sneabacter namystus]|uniref:Ribosomal RNA small subunit methyltransferase E n=1 Tax=Candidatus Sneabacter namystus TaxID=2601646 RepID=A0A5C0UJ82_9RICK|nr:RsmE family RNA methyltransferase [Candidatus Sneabacter namystus]QEK39522.1 16S rRNA (uracil(1498)-N(3))-methyltransferase [Candidatus Sneabacter namystus]
MSRRPRIFSVYVLQEGLKIELTPEQVLYLLSVLRLKDNDTLEVFNASCGSFLAKFVVVDNKRCFVVVESFLSSPERLFPLSIAIALINKDRFRDAIDMATQLGCTRIVPILCERSNREKFNMKRVQRVVTAAAEQSGRCTLPEIMSPISLESFVYNNSSYILYADLLGKERVCDFKDKLLDCVSISLLIGPEGGFSVADRKVLSSIESVNFGSLTLRSETAVACFISQVKLFLPKFI